MHILKDTIFRYRNEINKRERNQLDLLINQIWDKLSLVPQDGVDELKVGDEVILYPVYFRSGIKIVKKGDNIKILAMHTEPYMPIYHKWILELILKNI